VARDALNIGTHVPRKASNTVTLSRIRRVKDFPAWRRLNS
jgi:hypothetical protein